MSGRRAIVVGTRRSKLARRQTERVCEMIQSAHPDVRCRVKTFVTEGDKRGDVPLQRMGGRGVFTSQLEEALKDGKIDVAVHSMKDLPTEDQASLAIAAVVDRTDARDCVVTHDGHVLADLPPGAVVGTSSTRREAQLRALRPDLEFRTIRGNVETRIRKVRRGEYDATVLAVAGLQRLGLTKKITEYLPLDRMLPAPGQGALAVQCRSDDVELLQLLAAIDDRAAREAVTAERTLLEQLGGGCSLPVAAFAERLSGALHLTAAVVAPDGRTRVDVSGTGVDPEELGTRLAHTAVARGAMEILRLADGEVKPLRGRRIVITRAAHQAGFLRARLAQLGAVPIVVPTIEIAPVADAAPITAAIGRLSTYDWVVFTSTNAVAMFWRMLTESGFTTEAFGSARIAAVGPRTADALAKRGVACSFMPNEFRADVLVRAIGRVKGCRILLPRADIARDEIPERLRKEGAVVDDIAIYRTLPAPISDDHLRALESGVDAVTFTSGSTVRSFVDAVEKRLGRSWLDGTVVSCIGPVTAETARELGLRVDLVAESYTAGGLVDALVSHYKGAAMPSEGDTP